MKNTTEWSVEFDLLYNNIASDKAPGLNAYEKSVCLTDAQENVIVMLYNGTIREPFESSEEVTRYLSSLISQSDWIPDNSADRIHIIPDSKIYKCQSTDSILFKTFESCKIWLDQQHQKSVQAAVVPVTQDEFWRIHRDPFKREGLTRVLRLSYSDSSVSNGNLSETDYSELISKYDIDSYTVRYLRKPRPIILESLEGTGLSIEGETGETTCMMPEVLHHTILVEAVRLAQAAWSSNNQ